MIKTLEDFKVHHVGCAVESIENSLITYRDIIGFNNVSQVYRLEEIGINACFVEMGQGFFIELIEPINQKSIINNYIKKGISYYHLGYIVKNITETLAKLLEAGFKEVASVHSPAFGNRLCIFLYTPEFHLIEIIESD